MRDKIIEIQIKHFGEPMTAKARERLEKIADEIMALLPAGFPVQGGYGEYEASIIPMWLAEEVYKSYASQYGTSQSLERLGERGGFGREEVLTLLQERQAANKLAHVCSGEDCCNPSIIILNNE